MKQKREQEPGVEEKRWSQNTTVRRRSISTIVTGLRSGFSSTKPLKRDLDTGLEGLKTAIEDETDSEVNNIMFVCCTSREKVTLERTAM